MKTMFYDLEILCNDRIMTKVYGKLKNKNVNFDRSQHFLLFLLLIFFKIAGFRRACHSCPCYNWASEASPTLGCSIEISRDICIYVVGMSRMSN